MHVDRERILKKRDKLNNDRAWRPRDKKMEPIVSHQDLSWFRVDISSSDIVTTKSTMNAAITEVDQVWLFMEQVKSGLN